MFRHSLQHTAREPSLAKRFAVIVIAGLVATIGTVMVGRMSFPLTAMSPVSGTVQQTRATVGGSLRHIARSRCARLSALPNLFDRQGPTVATGDYTPAMRKPVGCSLRMLLADIGLEQGPVTGRSLVLFHTPLAVVTRGPIHAQRGINGATSTGVPSINAADRRGDIDETSADAQQVLRRSTEEFPNEI